MLEFELSCWHHCQNNAVRCGTREHTCVQNYAGDSMVTTLACRTQSVRQKQAVVSLSLIDEKTTVQLSERHAMLNLSTSSS